MTAQAAQILEEFRKLPAPEQRGLCETILRELGQLAVRQKTIGDIAGRYRPLPDGDKNQLDRVLAEAIAASKI